VAKIAQRLMGKIGMAIGIVIIAGSLVGGVALAADLGRTDDPEGRVPVSDDGAVTPGGTAALTGAATTAGSEVTSSPDAPPAGGTDAASPPAQTSASPPAQPSPNCWVGPSERPDGIEKCEDD
jgi:hypothetical protein